MLKPIEVSERKIDDNSIVKLKNRILAIINIASSCGQAITFDEIALTLPQNHQEINIRERILSDQAILDKISIHNELVTLKGNECLFRLRSTGEEISKRKIENAILFARCLLGTRSYVKLLAICGSVAYESATEDGDTDLFLISQKNRMWLTFTKMLVLARILNRNRRGDHPNFCLSYIQDEENFTQELSTHRDLLFAREFLSIKVLSGQESYHELISQAKWLKKALPLLYQLKVNDNNELFRINESYLSSRVFDAVNSVLFLVIGNYLRLKAFMKNLTLRKKNKQLDLFEAKITKGSCVYNSERYRELERLYSSIIND